MKSSQELSNGKSNDNQAAAALSGAPDNYDGVHKENNHLVSGVWINWANEKIISLDKENQELYEKLARSQSLVTELEATIESLRDKLEERR